MNENEQNHNNFDLLDFIVEINALNDLITSLDDITTYPAKVGMITKNSNAEAFDAANEAINQYNKLIRLMGAMLIISRKITDDSFLLSKKYAKGEDLYDLHH
ncbi:hypothetical protein JK159_04395 [Weissella minor]|uniref:hypothetical protein n=1 Tax=Weissella minor TaxID=1620 RepID=UPI001BB0C5F3|nr:hypothetical protein [Weissella minor]MBS0949605.1 hypothetical protein [Weissella minor]